ncbi:uncharacterized protein FOMMEDRAFT_162697 [Fomitiporia mediterranea MF3/22]|uniref:Uncharacterized protein n=1 Tax=Fomitiporia mediterranea (strain MF3/22) TaxID=694068 RepID=R7SG34_FOMME|nr:uncharacterized protein FOMMEDRAFT_162697 [Fomitiporia mediterranea MF3/22]EJC97673.1 hypothetical protein FOMMEDRAFT_162697 [Fomitiporia mediterranea MF3/22]
MPKVYAVRTSLPRRTSIRRYRRYLLDKCISSYTRHSERSFMHDAVEIGGNQQCLSLGISHLSKSARQEIRNIRNCGISAQQLISKKAPRDAVITPFGRQPGSIFLSRKLYFEAFPILIQAVRPWTDLTRYCPSKPSECRPPGLPPDEELLDEDGPFFAKTVYECMCDCEGGEVRYKRVAAGLRKAAVELKGRADIQTERWVNLIHIGAQLDLEC